MNVTTTWLRARRTASTARAGRQRIAKPGIVPRVTVQVEVLSQATDEAVEAFGRLLPQLSRSAAPLDKTALAQIITAPASTLLVARSGGVIVGTLTLVMFPIPTGLRAWIEDVVVDEAAGRQGVGSALTLEALRLARDAGARTVDLSSRPSRVAAGKLYEKLGFQTRETRMYRYALD
jgi:ribosomal protein S18 acetylase RimI-like enzyme